MSKMSQTRLSAALASWVQDRPGLRRCSISFDPLSPPASLWHAELRYRSETGGIWTLAIRRFGPTPGEALRELVAAMVETGRLV